MIKIENIKKSFGDKTVFEDISFVLNSGEKVGFIGKNGGGKTTILKIITGEIEPDEGNVIIDKNERIGYLPQTIEGDFEKTIKHFFLSSQEIQDWQVKKYLGKLGIKNINIERKLKSFSGGETTRIALAKILINNPTMLLLDEPTNHLDIEGISYLQNFLSFFDGGILLVSHDRWILDKVPTKIIELQLTEKGRTTKIYSGNFSVYKEERRKEIQKQETLYRLQERNIDKEKKEIRRLKEKSKKFDRNLISKLRADGLFMNSRGVKFAKKAISEEKRISKLMESDKRIEKPQKEKSIKFELISYLPKTQRVIFVEEVSFSFKEKCILDSINFELYGQERVSLMGLNGSGKTTFINVLLGKLKPCRGILKMNPSIRVGYLPQEIKFKDDEITVLEEFGNGLEIDQNEVRDLLGRFLFSKQSQIKKIKSLSIGERKRLCLAKIVASGANFLILDEPTNHLDIPSIEALEKALFQFKGAMLIISHDRYFLKNIGIKKFYYLKCCKLEKFNSLDGMNNTTKLRS